VSLDNWITKPHCSAPEDSMLLAHGAVSLDNWITTPPK